MFFRYEGRGLLRRGLRVRADYLANPAVNLALLRRWTLCDKAAQLRLALRYIP
jgi:hypothetical protein